MTLVELRYFFQAHFLLGELQGTSWVTGMNHASQGFSSVSSLPAAVTTVTQGEVPASWEERKYQGRQERKH